MTGSRLALALALAAPAARADVYMHNPRGSNDRNCERNVNRNNGNRMFDSQNNAAGGYACPRAVGDATTQAENGEANFGSVQQNMKMWYYEGSQLPVEWTNQHGCGPNSKVNCEVVIQYMCEDTADPQVNDFWPYTATKNAVDNRGTQAFRSGDNIATPRDGIPTDADDSATDTIPDDVDNAIPDNAADQRYGMHESFSSYANCKATERNKGLYTADQRMRRNDARGTRQNPNGDRRGLECPEERDYYPYWGLSQWADVAILTNDGGDEVCTVPGDCETQRCEYYLANTFNKNTKGYCDVPKGTDVNVKLDSDAWQGGTWYNNREACDAAGGFEWFEISLDQILTGIDYPVCQKTQFSRVNQLGNAEGGANLDSDDFDKADSPQGVNANRFVWTVPSIPTAAAAGYFNGHTGAGIADAYKSCSLRIRYNISTSDMPVWSPDAMETSHPWKYSMVTAANNSNNKGDAGPNTPLVQDPYIYVGPGDSADTGKQFVSLAVNTNQFSRTFQDRTYTFGIKSRPVTAAAADDLKDSPAVPVINPGAAIININVRGKRGNIVQTYPSVEYDFVPNQVAVDDGDYVHFQWTGSDYNPRRGCNDGEGGPPDPNDFRTAANAKSNSRADRTNVVLLNTMAENVPTDMLGSPATTLAADGSVVEATYADQMTAAMDATVAASPCANDADYEACYAMIMRLTYLNQQSDGGSLALRRGDACLTEAELDDINNKNERENHPLNCAKLNAKPNPYFNGGAMKVGVGGSFTFFSSRNNNFSNRDQTGILCVRGVDDDGNTYTCDTDANGVLQDVSTLIGTSGQRDATAAAQRAARCNEEASADGFANSAGAASCIGEADGDDILEGGTATIEQKDNDKIGDGNKDACDKIFWFYKNLTKVEQALVLGLSLMAAGIALVFCGNYLYNLHIRGTRKDHTFDPAKGDWKKGDATGKDKTMAIGA